MRTYSFCSVRSSRHRALGREEDLARGAIRFSLGKDNTPEDIARLLEILPASVENLRRLSPSKV